MEKLNFEIKYTAEDLQNSYTLHFAKMYPIRSRLVLVLAAALISIGVSLAVMGKGIAGYSAQGGFYIVIGLVAIAFYFWNLKTMGRRMFKKMPDFKLSYEYIIDDTGMTAFNKQLRSEVKWEHFWKALITDNMILLYPNKFRYNLFPKKNFTDEQYALLKSIVKQKIKNCKEC